MLEELKKLGFTDEEAKKVVDNQKVIEETIVKDKYVPLARFNEVNGDLSKANKSIEQKDKDIEDIKLKVGDNEQLKKDIADLQATRKQEADTAKADREKLRKETAIKLEIAGKVHDVDDVVSKIDLSKIDLDGETTKIKSGFREQYDSLKKEKSYLFVEEKPADNTRKFGIKGINQPKDGQGSGVDTDKDKVNAGVELAKKLAQNKTGANITDDYYFGGNKGGEQ